MLQESVQAMQQAQAAAEGSGEELWHVVLPKLLEWPFLLFVALMWFWCLFGKETQSNAESRRTYSFRGRSEYPSTGIVKEPRRGTGTDSR